MGRIKKALSSRLGFSLVENTAVLLIATVLFHPFWEENDDIWIAALTEGVFGGNEPHVIFSNFLYGKLLCLLQTVMPGVRWHAVIMYLFAFIMSTAFVYVLSGDKKGKILSSIFLAGSFYEIYVALQFSKVPALIAFTGYMILFDLCKENGFDRKTKRILSITVWISMLFALLIRTNAVLLVTMFAGIYGLVRVIRDMVAGELSKTIKKYVLYFAPVALIYITCRLADSSGYIDNDWSRYKEYRNQVSNLVDYHYKALMYNDHGDELAKMGVSENDAFMFVTWQFGDDEYLTDELLAEITALDITGIRSIDIDMLKAWVSNIHETVFVLNPLVIGLVLIFGLYAGYVVKHGLKSFDTAVIITQALLVVGVLFYFQYCGRWNHRVAYAVLLVQFILYLYLVKEDAGIDISPSMIACMVSIMLFGVASVGLSNEFSYREFGRNTADYSLLAEYMQDNKDKLFIVDTFTMQDFGRYDVLRSVEKGQFDNMAFIGGSYANSPVAKSILRSRGYENPFRALDSRDDSVILVDNVCPDKKVLYCSEHCDGNAYSLKDLGTVGGLHLYNIQ